MLRDGSHDIEETAWGHDGTTATGATTATAARISTGRRSIASSTTSGGGHEPQNLTLVCSSHHRACHDGLLTIRGAAPNVEVRWTRDPERSPHVGRQPVADETFDQREQRPPHVGPISEAKDLASGADRRHAKASSTFAAVGIRRDASQALVQLGFKRQEVRAALDAACASVGPHATLEQLLFEALRCCPKPRG